MPPPEIVGARHGRTRLRLVRPVARSTASFPQISVLTPSPPSFGADTAIRPSLRLYVWRPLSYGTDALGSPRFGFGLDSASSVPSEAGVSATTSTLPLPQWSPTC